MQQRPLIVLVPGLSPFDPTSSPLFAWARFRAVERNLAEQGVEAVVAAGIPPAGPVEQRAEALKRFLDTRRAERVVLIGHSMGGLDGRFLAARLDPDRRVRALATLATPHRGSQIADWALTASGPFPALLRLIGRAGIADLTPAACAARNRLLTDPPGLPILSVGAMRPRAEHPLLLRALVPDLPAEDGPHDGLVSVASARWGEFLGTVHCDHFELIGIELAPSALPVLRELLSARPPYDYLALFRRVWAWAAPHAAA